MKITKNLSFAKILLFISFLMLTTFGCDERKANSDRVLDFLRGIINKSGDRVNMRQRAQLAMSRWQDGIMDPKPFVIDAHMMVGSDENGERAFLILIIYDEDADYIGFEVEEEYIDPNGVITTQLVEKYPVFTYLSYSSEVELKSIPLLVRNKNQRKPEEQWLKYISTPLQKQKEEYKKRTKQNWTWKKTLPPVWVSIPDPNKVYVNVRVYDNAGHVSERVRLDHELRRE